MSSRREARMLEAADEARREAIWNACRLLFDPEGDNGALAVKTVKALRRIDEQRSCA